MWSVSRWGKRLVNVGCKFSQKNKQNSRSNQRARMDRTGSLPQLWHNREIKPTHKLLRSTGLVFLLARVNKVHLNVNMRLHLECTATAHMHKRTHCWPAEIQSQRRHSPDKRGLFNAKSPHPETRTNSWATAELLYSAQTFGRGQIWGYDDYSSPQKLLQMMSPPASFHL